MLKKCKDCLLTKEASDFYGVQGECKECTKNRVHKNYVQKIDYYRAYEVDRNKRPKRKEQKLKYQRKRRALYPHKDIARSAVRRAVISGLLKKLPCVVCGSEKVEAHHENHFEALNIKWLCKKHHFEVDRLLKINKKCKLLQLQEQT